MARKSQAKFKMKGHSIPGVKGFKGTVLEDGRAASSAFQRKALSPIKTYEDIDHLREMEHDEDGEHLGLYDTLTPSALYDRDLSPNQMKSPAKQKLDSEKLKEGIKKAKETGVDLDVTREEQEKIDKLGPKLKEDGPLKQVAKKATGTIKEKLKERFDRFLDEDMIKEFFTKDNERLEKLPDELSINRESPIKQFSGLIGGNRQTRRPWSINPRVARKATKAIKEAKKTEEQKNIRKYADELRKAAGSATPMKSPLEHEGGTFMDQPHRDKFGPNHIHKYDKDGNLVPSKSKGRWDMSNTILGGQLGRTAKKAIKEAKKKTEKRTKPFEEFLNEDVYKHLRKPMGSN